MAGFDSRQSRATFAFSPAQPVETRNTLDPGFRGGAVQGGQSAGGVVRATPFTLPTDDGIPDFLLQMAEPYIREKQSEAVVKGATDFAAGKTITDIAKGDSGIASIFGPSGYHQGAAAFAASDAWAKTKTDIANDPNVETLSTDKLGSYLAEKYRGMMTGDPIADQMLQHQMMQDHGPLVASLTAKHEAYVARTALNNWSNTADSNADYLQSVMSNPALDGPSGEEQRKQALQTYAGSVLTPPYGMKQETFQAGLVASARNALAKGNFYAFETLKSSGIDKVLTDEQSARMELAYQSGTAKAFGLVSSNPQVNRLLATLDMNIRVGEYKSPAEIVKPVEEINRIAAGLTGIRGRKLISGDDLLAMQKSLNEGTFQAGLRLQAQQFQLARQQADHEWELHVDEVKAQQKLQIAMTMTASGNMAAGLATGAVSEPDANLVFGKAVQAGDMGTLANNFASGRYVNSFSASQLQGPVANSVGIGVTKGFEQSYAQWSKLNKANPAAAVAYYGEYAANMEGYDRLVNGGEQPIAAYAQTFGKGPDLGRTDLPEGVKRKDAVSAVRAAITAEDKRYFGFAGSRTPLSNSGVEMMTNWLLPKAGAYARTSGISIDDAVVKVRDAAFASGEIERAGPFVWNNQHTTKKLGDYLGLPAEGMDKLVTQVAQDRLTKAGLGQGAGGTDYTTMRVQDSKGNPSLYVMGYKSDHSGHVDVLITLDELRAANRKNIADIHREPVKFKIDISEEATRARRESYRHAMDQ